MRSVGRSVRRWVGVAGLALMLAPCAARAEPTFYNVHVLNFDMWCQETRHYDPDRCDSRQPDDVAEFEAYRGTVERYELPYLKRVEEERQENDRMHHDPQPHPVGH